MVLGRNKGGEHALQSHPLSVLAIAVGTGFLFVVAAVNSGGSDLRPSGGDLSSLLVERNEAADQREQRAELLQADITELSGSVETGAIAQFNQISEGLTAVAGLTEVEGPGLEIVLTDSPPESVEPGLNPNIFVVHEQDLRGFVNALWAGGAEAVSLQGQRLISTVGIKCVGTTVLLNGRSYSPPFRIQAVGDPAELINAINTLPETVTFTDYSQRYDLGLSITTLPAVKIPAHEGTLSLQYAAVATVD